MRRVAIVVVLAALLLFSLSWAATVIVMVTWTPTGGTVIVPNPVVVNQGDTIEFQLGGDPSGVCMVTAGPPLNWNVGPFTPGSPASSRTTPAINVAPGTYNYQIECGQSAQGGSIPGTVIVQGPVPNDPSTWGAVKAKYK